MTRRVERRPDVDLLDGEFYARNPYPEFAWMRHHEPVFHDERHDVWGISRYHDVRAIGQDPETFSSAGGSRPDTGPLPHMIDTDAPEHRRRRRLVSARFTPAAVRASARDLRRHCDRLVDAVCAQGSCDLVRDLAAPLPLDVVADMLGFPEEDRPLLLRWSEDLLASQGPVPGGAQAAMDAFVAWQSYLSTRIDAARRDDERGDLIADLVHGEVDGERLDDQSVMYEALLILIGGDETTRHVISGGIEALLRHPDQWRALSDDRSLLPSAVEEMLRWVTPIKNMNRTATRAVTLHGRTIPHGARVLLLYPSANRDESMFRSPESFDVRRAPNDHLAFGFGAHLCLGNRLARAELAAMVQCLLERLPDLRLDDACPAELPRRPSYFISGLETLPVTFAPRAPTGSRGKTTS